MHSSSSDPEALQPDPTIPGVVPAADDDAWHARLRGALGDDDALLALLRDHAPLPVKHCAVAELQGEAALRVAERALRDQDRALYRLAKQRHDHAMARRRAREQAAALVAEARTLVGASASTERLVEIDRRWQALDGRLLDAVQHDDYAELMAELGACSHRAAPAEPSVPVPQAPQAQPSPPPSRPAARKRRREGEAEIGATTTRDTASEQRLDAELCAAQSALDEGHVARTASHLAAIKRLLETSLAPPAPMCERIDALQAEYARLAGWRQWSGGRARDELVQQAEALAAATAVPAPGPKLQLKRHAETIDELRERWKALDRLGTITPRSLWQRFDAALTAAYRPVAEHVAAQRSARERNRGERERLIAALEALPLPADGSPPDDWRALAAAIERFHGDWRRLGPLEHSVEHAARRPLAARLAAALQRLELALQSQRSAARLERERLVQRAKVLAGDLHGRDWMPRVRELQAEWQRQARTLPLARADEQALWNDFRAAIDGAFAAREAAFKARDAEQQALWQQRADCVDRLEKLPADLTAAQVRHALAEADAQWQRVSMALRGPGADWQRRFERACERLHRRLADQAQQGWFVTCDTLQAKLALCESLEGADAPALDAHERAIHWSQWPALPEPLERALAGRAGLKPPSAPLATPTDELLLQFEDRWAVPTPAAFAEARHALKLLRLKAALESRRVAMSPTEPLPQLAGLLARTGLDASQRGRLRALLDELRRRGPDALRPA
jgi:exonuclease SbcC